MKPEVKSPAGHWPQLRAAIEAGADAVYFGLTHFTARAKSGFTLAELPEAMQTLRSRGVKGYVTFNTLIFDSEIRAAAQGLAQIAEAGADAIIVQDWAAVKLAREIAPQLPIHGSTQMSVTDAAGARHAYELGVRRLILGRELSLAQVRAVRNELAREQIPVELEIFVHGALCVSYSGQCFSSEAWGGRSANRGQCAQACRLPYELIVDGAPQPLGDARYLLSPGDLYALEQIPEIVEIGLAALKIEGRYKDADYVALTTRAYREAVDQAWSHVLSPPEAETKAALEQVYSRGLGPWFLTGTDHQAVVRGRSPRHRGRWMGTVAEIQRDRVLIHSKESGLKPGDGVVFDSAAWRSPQEAEEGGRLFSVRTIQPGLLELAFANGAIHPERIRAGDLLWRTDDPEIAKLARPYLEPSAPMHRQPVDVRVMARQGQPLEITFTLPNGISATVQSASAIGKAEKNSADAASIRAQLDRLGNTAYRLGELQVEVEGRPFLPASLLNQLRREAVEQLEQLQRQAPGIEVRDSAEAVNRVLSERATYGTEADAARLHLLVRNNDQLEAALGLRPASITLDYLDLYGLKPSLERARASGIETRIAAPRILKPGEESIADFLVRCEVPILVRSAGLIEAIRLRHPDKTLILDGDFSLNAANSISADLLLKLGLRRLAPTHDLNGAQIADLARHETGIAPRLEVIAYHHLPVFHTEHCVFCRFLSTGTSYKDCGRPCERHLVSVRDSSGRAHPVMADVGCRNTVFGAEAQEGSAYLDRWRGAGICHFRLEFVHETADEVKLVTQAFSRWLHGGLPAGQLQRTLAGIAPQGITQGSFFVPAGGIFPANALR